MYNSANSEVYKMLQEQANEPDEPGKDELFSHYYNLAVMLKLLNGNQNIFVADQLID